jgi:hypothetical protein
MRARRLAAVTAVALIGWLASGMVGARAPASAFGSAALAVGNDSGYASPSGGAIHRVDWYQGQEGKWHEDRRGQWYWHPRGGDEWYWGQRGHWYRQPSGWKFGTNGLVCDNNETDCRYGRYLPANGEGMVNRKNPNLYWHCDSHGNHCNWARRP